MNGIERMATIVDIIFYSVLGIGALVVGSLYFLKKKGYFNRKKEKEESYKNPQEKDIEEFMNFQDIKNDMLIKDNYHTFIAGVRTNGTDYFNATLSEKGRIIQSYIEYVNTIGKLTKLFIQAAEDDVSEFLNYFDGLIAKHNEKIEALVSDIEQLKNTLSQVDEDDFQTIAMIETEINKKNRMIRNYQWMVERIKHKRYFVEQTASSTVRDKFESYIFTEYTHDDDTFGVELSKEEIMQRAKQDIDIQLKSIIRGHARAEVECSRLDGNELGRIMRNTFNPLDGDQIKFDEFLKSNMFSLIATGDDEETIQMRAFLEEMEEKGEKKVAV